MASQKKYSKRKSIQNSDPGKILDLVMHLNVDKCALMQITLNEYLRDECEAELVVQVIVHEERMEASIEAVGHNLLPRKHKINMPEIFTEVMKSSSERIVLLNNLPFDFLSIVVPYAVKDNVKKQVVLSPVLDQPFCVIVCIISPKIPEEHVSLIVRECFLFCWPTIKKTISLEYECRLKEKCQHLLRVARRLFIEVASLNTVLHIAMDQAKQLTKAEYCSVMLVDVERMELTESYYANKNDKETVERRYPMNIGIVGQVINTGVLVNAKSAKDHPAYDPKIDGREGVVCKSILCFPIREQTGMIGVGQLINKIGDPYFDGMDEEMALAFSIYCGICIIHSVIYEKIQEAHIRNALANELVMYHMKVSDSEVTNLLECTGFHNHPHLAHLHFNTRALPLRELSCFAFKMFFDLGFDKKFQIKKKKLARFILQVKKGYRDVPYHNWLHAFSVGQWAYGAMLNYKLISSGYITDLQGLMYLVAGLTHDIDHRGTTNSFQIQGQTTLAALYSSEGSVMERHHLAQAICILNTEGCDILENLPRRDYDRALMLLKDFILATDLSNYFKNFMEFKTISMDYQKGFKPHTAVLQALLMNAADLGDQLKDWGCIKKTAAAVLTEFFNQGDVEKNRGDLPPIIMDREKCFIPDLEIQFIHGVCVPLFSMIGNIIPKSKPMVKILENHIERWEAARPIFAEVPITAGLSVLLSPELDNLIDQHLKDKEKHRLEEAEGEHEEIKEG